MALVKQDSRNTNSEGSVCEVTELITLQTIAQLDMSYDKGICPTIMGYDLCFCAHSTCPSIEEQDLRL